MRASHAGCVAALVCMGMVAGAVQAADAPASKAAGPSAPPGAAKLPAAALDAAHRAKARQLMDGGVAYLLRQRQPNGGWSMGRGGATGVCRMGRCDIRFVSSSC